MSEENKKVELNDDELSKVTGGVTQNEDGTYNILKEEFFSYGTIYYRVLYDNYNVGLDEQIWVEYFSENPANNGMIMDNSLTKETVGMLLYYCGYISKYSYGNN